MSRGTCTRSSQNSDLSLVYATKSEPSEKDPPDASPQNIFIQEQMEAVKDSPKYMKTQPAESMLQVLDTPVPKIVEEKAEQLEAEKPDQEHYRSFYTVTNYYNNELGDLRVYQQQNHT